MTFSPFIPLPLPLLSSLFLPSLPSPLLSSPPLSPPLPSPPLPSSLHSTPLLLSSPPSSFQPNPE